MENSSNVVSDLSNFENILVDNDLNLSPSVECKYNLQEGLNHTKLEEGELTLACIL